MEEQMMNKKFIFVMRGWVKNHLVTSPAVEADDRWWAWQAASSPSQSKVALGIIRVDPNGPD